MKSVHEEADFVEAFAPSSVLDAGCGTGRVAIELARRGIDVVGVDIDPKMLSAAREKAPHLEWHLGDLAVIDLKRKFEVVLMAGNVITFLGRGTEGAVLRNMRRHLALGGRMITGFQLSMAYLGLEEYDRLAEEAGLALVERYAGWARESWTWASSYVVSVHRHHDL